MRPISQVIADLQAQLDRYAGWPVLTVDVKIADLRALLDAHAREADERARCAAACRAVAAGHTHASAVGAALVCAAACERGAVSR